MAKKDKYYVVWKGVTPGIYETWRECEEMVKNYPDARFKAFKSLDEAETAFHSGSSIPPKRSLRKSGISSQIKKDAIAVDAACEGNPGLMEYQGVNIHSGEKIFYKGPFEQGTNNVGEFLAIVHALAYLSKLNKPDTTIYSDSITAISWVRNKRTKTNLIKTKKNEILFTLIDRAINWLNTNTYMNPIIKWETEEWGENPADFGRK
jgi:ribonuclease HI